MQVIREVELAFIGCCLESAEGVQAPVHLIEALDLGCSVDWFADPTCRLVWTAMERCYRTGKLATLSVGTIWQEADTIRRDSKSPFKGLDFSALQFYTEAIQYRERDDIDDLPSLSDILRNRALANKMVSVLTVAQQKIGHATDACAAAENIIPDLLTVLNADAPTKALSGPDIINRIREQRLKAREARAAGNFSYVPGIPYPWLPLSHKLKGLGPGLHIVAARPSVGKTSFVLQCMDYWCQMGYRVAFNCLDMDAHEALKRPIANRALVSLDKIDCGEDGQAEDKKIAAAENAIMDSMQGNFLRLFNETDVDKFVSTCSMLLYTKSVDIIVVDFLQRLHSRRASKEYEILKYATAALKSVANRYHVPVVLLSQLNRSSVTGKDGVRDPELSDLRGSGTIEQDATTVILLNPDKTVKDAWKAKTNGGAPIGFTPIDTDDATREEVADGLVPIWVEIKKNQNGKTGRFPFVVYNNWFRWYMGDYKAEPMTGSEKNIPYFSRLLVDWRCAEEPYLSAKKCGCVLEPNYWHRDVVQSLGMLGLAVPASVASLCSASDKDNYENLLAERAERMRPKSEVAIASRETNPVELVKVKESNEYF